MIYIRAHGETLYPVYWCPASDYIEEAFKSFINTPKTEQNTPVYVSVPAEEEENGVFNGEFIYGMFGIYYMTCGNHTYQLRQ